MGRDAEMGQSVYSYVHALVSAALFCVNTTWKPVSDTAGAAADIAAAADKTEAAIASELAGEVYGLKSIRANIEDAEHNTTRFIILSKKPVRPKRNGDVVVTSFVFRVRNVPAALFKALGGFATNGVNMTKLESYMVGGDFFATQFYADVEGDPRDRNVKLAFEELDFYTHEVKVLGTYRPIRFVSKG